MGEHRAARSGSRRRTPDSLPLTQVAVAGKRRAAPATKTRRGAGGPLLRSLPSVPVVAGVATLAIAMGGAAQGAGAEARDLVAAPVSVRQQPASALTGTGGVAAANPVGSREAIVSRDSDRQTLQKAVTTKVQKQVEQQAATRNSALTALRSAAEKQARKIQANAWVLPVSPAAYRLTAFFGASSGLWSSTHTGLDFAAPSGTPIMAVAGGVVTETAYSGAYGNRTIVTLDDGTELWYCHQTSYAVSPGQVVRSGDVIGTVGSTGNSTGPHMHLEVRPGGGDPVDPYQALIAHGIQP